MVGFPGYVARRPSEKKGTLLPWPMILFRLHILISAGAAGRRYNLEPTSSWRRYLHSASNPVGGQITPLDCASLSLKGLETRPLRWSEDRP